jgi:hypothetical protein
MNSLYPSYLLDRVVITICKKGNTPECVFQINFVWLTTFYRVVRLPQSRYQSKKCAYFVRRTEFMKWNCRQRVCCFVKRVANKSDRRFTSCTCGAEYKPLNSHCFTSSVFDKRFNGLAPSLSRSQDARFRFFTGSTDLSIRDSKCASDGSNRSNSLHPSSPLSFIQFEIRADHPSGNRQCNGGESDAYYFFPCLHAFSFRK